MRGFVVIVTIFIVVTVCFFYHLRASARANWRQITLTFSGFTNTANGGKSIISIRNNGHVAVRLRDSFALEYLGVHPYQPVSGLSNLVRYMPTQTNLVISPGTVVDFLIVTPAEGKSWVASLEFSPAGAWTGLGERLIRSQNKLVKMLPTVVAGVPLRAVPCYTVAQQFDMSK